MKRVIAIVNKWWECDAALVPVFDLDSRAKDLLPWPSPGDLHHPHQRTNPTSERAPDLKIVPRVTLHLNSLVAEIWCISDILEHLPDRATYQSSSWQKVQRLPAIIAAGDTPDCVIAVGTAAMSDPALNFNGSVVVGTQVFLFDPYAGKQNPDSPWGDESFGKVLLSTIDSKLFAFMTLKLQSFQLKFLATGRTGDHQRTLICEPRGIALCDVNVTDNTLYATVDPQAVAACKKVTSDPIVSVETTHGVIRAVAGSSFLFVSGISNRFGRFVDEVGPAGYSQTFPAAHNAGLVLCGVISSLNEYWSNAPPRHSTQPFTSP
ncbi:MAG TPA: hypothetical protein VG028_05455 [Terriglobia bacterium]|nr:hypothetical protein [Terriglobia bacterium]